MNSRVKTQLFSRVDKKFYLTNYYSKPNPWAKIQKLKRRKTRNQERNQRRFYMYHHTRKVPLISSIHIL